MSRAISTSRNTGSSRPGEYCPARLLAFGRHDDHNGPMSTTSLRAEDYEAIRQTLARANHAIDHGRSGQWVTCFTDDGTYECLGLPPDAALGGRHSGVRGLTTYADVHFQVHKGRARSSSSSELIEPLQNGRASVTSYLTVFEAGQQGMAGVLATATCHDEMIKTQYGRWLIASRSLTIDSEPEDSETEA